MLTIKTPSRMDRSSLRGFQYAKLSGLRTESWLDYEDRRQDFALAMLEHGDHPCASPLAELERPSKSMLDRCKKTIKARYNVGRDEINKAELDYLRALINGKSSIDIKTLDEEYSGIILTALGAGRLNPQEVKIKKGKLKLTLTAERKKEVRNRVKLLMRANWVNPVKPQGKPAGLPSTKPYCVPCPIVQSPHSPEGFYCPIPAR